MFLTAQKNTVPPHARVPPASFSFPAAALCVVDVDRSGEFSAGTYEVWPGRGRQHSSAKRRVLKIEKRNVGIIE